MLLEPGVFWLADSSTVEAAFAMSRRSRNSRAWRYVWGGIRRDADARALVLASEREDWSYDLVEVRTSLLCVSLLPECGPATICSFFSFSSSAILTRRRTSLQWWCPLSPVLCQSQESPTVAVIPRLRPATTLACEVFTKSKTVTVERMTKVINGVSIPEFKLKITNHSHLSNLIRSLTYFHLFFRVWLGLGHQQPIDSNFTELWKSESELPLGIQLWYGGCARLQGAGRRTALLGNQDDISSVWNRHGKTWFISKRSSHRCAICWVGVSLILQMVGIGTSDVNLDKYRHTFCSLLGKDTDSWGLSYTGKIPPASLHRLTLGFTLE